MASEEKPFPLTRFFVVTSFFTTVLITVATVFISSRAVREELLEEAKDNAVSVIRTLQNDIQRHFIEPTLAERGAIDLADEAQYERLDGVVRREVSDSFSIRSIYIFDHEGTILYSTNREHVGFRTPPSNDLYWEAVEGRVSSAIRLRGAPLDVQQAPAASALLETYVPVHSLGEMETEGGAVSNVIETYQDVDRLQAEVAQSQVRIATHVVAGSAILFLVLLGIVMRADRLIRRQTRALVESNTRLRDLSLHLEAEVHRRTQQLIAREKLASLGTLAAGLAHEVNNPVATIAACAEGLTRRLHDRRDEAELDLEEFEEYLGLIEREAFRVKKITENLLDFSRQKPTGRKEETDVGRALEETLALLRVGGECEGIDLRVEGGGDEIRFRVDPTDLRQLIFNITRNAVDAVQARGSAAEAGRIRWSARRSGGGLELECADNGVGFDPEREGELVQPFFTTKPPGKGTGLGLALCHSMVERHGGQLVIQSAGPGMGAKVTVFLPSDGQDGNGSGEAGTRAFSSDP